MKDRLMHLKRSLKPQRQVAIRLDELDNYLKKEYPLFVPNSKKEVRVAEFKPLLQADYKGGLNCSITSMTACINYYTDGKYDIGEIYSYVVKVARFFLYTPTLWGTFSFTIKPIYAISLRHFGVRRKTGVGLLKNLGYNSGRIISRLNSGMPLLLNMFSDGRNCYHNHTVTVIGYRLYTSGKKHKLFLILNDNWSKEKRVLDYDKLWIISSINY